MYKVILVIHVMTTIALIAMVLAQRTSGDGMGLSGSSSSSFLSGRAAASFATRATSLLALLFILTSLSLGVITARNHMAAGTIADRVKAKTLTVAPLTAPTPDAAAPGSRKTPAEPAAKETAPTVPEFTKPAPSVPRPE